MTHACKTFHYGDAAVIRPECIEAANDAIRLANRVALSYAHPAYRAAESMLNHLTVAEMRRTIAINPVIGAGLSCRS